MSLYSNDLNTKIDWPNVIKLSRCDDSVLGGFRFIFFFHLLTSLSISFQFHRICSKWHNHWTERKKKTSTKLLALIYRQTYVWAFWADEWNMQIALHCNGNRVQKLSREELKGKRRSSQNHIQTMRWLSDKLNKREWSECGGAKKCHSNVVTSNIERWWWWWWSYRRRRHLLLLSLLMRLTMMMVMMMIHNILLKCDFISNFSTWYDLMQ